MADEKVKNLWGEDFRVVPEGLAETDVVIFFEKLIRQHREQLKQLDNIASLHDLATKTVQDAEALAANIREEAEQSAKKRSQEVLAEAEKTATEVLAKAQRESAELVDQTRAQIAEIESEFRSKAQDRFSRMDAAIKAVVEAAVQELATRMPSHYIGKHLHQSVHFIPAFENLIREVQADLPESDRISFTHTPHEPPASSSE